MHEKDMHSTVFQSARSLGAARAAAQYLPEHVKKDVLAYIERQHLKIDDWDTHPSWPEATVLRGQALTLANRVVEAAFVNVGGRSQSKAPTTAHF